jgi:ferredoxin
MTDAVSTPAPTETALGSGSTVALVLGEAGALRAIAGIKGEALLFALKRAGVPLPAICGGKGACGTCRIHVAPAWRERLVEPARREARLLSHLGAGEGDRLSCRIPLSLELAGLELHTCANQGDAQ